MTVLSTPPDTRPPAADDETATSGGMFRSLRVRNYRLYASGQLVSLTGNWMQRVAQDWLVLELTNSGVALGIVTALQFGPSLLSPWGGVIADRGDKRKILLGTQSALAVVGLVLGVLDLTGVVQLWHVMVLALLLGLINVVDSPTRQAFAVEMVGRRDVANAVAINSTTFNAARIMGPAIGGVTIAAVGTGWAFVANAASSVAVLAGLWAMRPAELFPAPVVQRARGQLIEGVRYVWRRPDLVMVMVLIFFISTFGLNFQITTALLAKQVFHRGASGYGLLSTALAVGACAGAVVATRRVRRPTQLFLVGSGLAFGTIEVLSGLMPSYGLTALLLVPTGLLMLTMTIAANSFVQLGVEPTMQGRVMALYVLCFMGGAPIGSIAVGWIAGALGPRWSLIGGGLVSLVTALVVAAVISRHRRLPGRYLIRRARMATQLAHAV